MRRFALSPLVLFALVACSTGGVHYEEPEIRRGAVVCEHPLATAAGLEILGSGGNAGDAAVATALALAVVYPQAGNLGGGGFAVWVGADGAARALDFREMAPADAHAQAYLDEAGVVVPERSLVGPLAVGVPGSPAGLYELYRECGSGRLTFAQLAQPAIDLARRGFAVDPWLARDLARESVREKMNTAARTVFYPDGQPLAAGDWLVQSELADTLQLLALNGPRAFYEGAVAEAVVAELRVNEIPGAGLPEYGIVTSGDLEGYEPLWREPLRSQFGGVELVTMPPPSSGGLVVLQVLGILEGLPLRGELDGGGASGRLSVSMAHWWIEALRRSFADRAEHMGDPDFNTVPVEQLLSPEWIAERRVSIGPRADLEVSAWVPDGVAESSETTHLSIVDERGNAVAMTTTLNGLFGSGMLVRGGGFFLNNEVDDFSIQAGAPNQFGLVGGRANALQPRKRPLSSMTPVVVRNAGGRVSMVLGSPGGPRIITSVLQVLLRVLVLEEDLVAAVRAPRLHQQWRPAETWFEAEQGGGWDPELLTALEALGHPVKIVERRIGSVQAIMIDEDGEPIATADPRRGGAAGVQGRGVQAPALPPRPQPAQP